MLKCAWVVKQGLDGGRMKGTWRRALPVRPVLAAAIALSVLALTPLIIRPASSAAQTAPVRIMPLGDSITGSPGCWRAILWNMLINAGYTNIDFVGTQPPQGCGVPYDGDNEGHGGALATGIVSQNQLPGWLAATNPDIVMMHLGTNDVWSGISTTAILSAYTTLVNQMRANNPNMKILVAQIIPMNPANCPACGQGVVALDNAIPGWASAHTTAQSPITVVDQWTGFSTATDTVDGVHPNDSGNQKMATKWYQALTPLLTAATPGPTPTPTPSPTSSTPGGGCTATYTTVNQWTGGLQGQVTVTGSGPSAISRWTVTLTLAAGETISQTWNATLTQSGVNATAVNLSWNGSLSPGGSTTFGFLATIAGGSAPATAACSAG
jgi:cellulase/cellobiase CelA1